MIVLDTNVISELIRLHPEPRVLDGVNSIDTPAVVTTATTAAELLFGAERLPNGHRRTMLVASIRMMLEEDLRGQVLPFDQTAAEAYARIRAGREASGRPINNADAQIAAICQVSHAAIPTRNVKDFEGVGIKIVNPWGDLSTAAKQKVPQWYVKTSIKPLHRDQRRPGRVGDVVTGWARRTMASRALLRPYNVDALPAHGSGLRRRIPADTPPQDATATDSRANTPATLPARILLRCDCRFLVLDCTGDI